MKKIILLVLGCMLVGQAYSNEVKTVDSIEVDRYLGRWYEIASIPQSFQKQCVGNTQAEYSLADNNQIKVLNSCDTKDGTRDESEARAKGTDPNNNAKMKVTFVKFITWIYPFGGDYWILDLADDYSFALVGEKTREYAWILARGQSMAQADLARMHAKLKENGYDTCKVLTSVQTGFNNERRPLCELFKAN